MFLHDALVGGIKEFEERVEFAQVFAWKLDFSASAPRLIWIKEGPEDRRLQCQAAAMSSKLLAAIKDENDVL